MHLDCAADGLKQVEYRHAHYRHAVLINISTKAVVVFLTAALSTACGDTPVPDNKIVEKVQNTYVGSQRCRACHENEYLQWSASHHAQAMQPVGPNTVLANTSGTVPGEATFAYEEDSLKVTIVDAAGELKTYPVTYTFGVEPLQQYLVELGNGKKQALREAWDSRPMDAGGQRWYHLYEGEEILPGDVIHWSSISQNWNSQCADCHSTGFRKGYDPITDNFESTWHELSVGCEACHGPGEAHALKPDQPLPANRVLQDPYRQPDICAQCHSRRTQIAEGYVPGEPLLDYYIPQLLSPPLYHQDGQILDEVYVYGSFLSSRMHAQGVTCNDCHNPHSADLLGIGDSVCLQCHAPAGNQRFPTLNKQAYASPQHHGHRQDSPGARCLACHMPTQTYMGVDVRHDHSFRIPRASVDPSVPNACLTCHSDQDRSWLKTHLPSASRAHFADTFDAALSSDTSTLLSKLARDKSANTIVRATALQRSANNVNTGVQRATMDASRAIDALLRHTALGNTAYLNPELRVGVVKRLLSDPVRAVRIEAARVALALDPEIRHTLGSTFDQALAEYRESLMLFAERAEVHVGLALIATSEGNNQQAELALNRALKINPMFVPALINLADLYRVTGRDADAEPQYRKAITIELPEADQAYALWLIRQARTPEALFYLARAFNNAPLNPQMGYIYAVALNNQGQTNKALEVLATMSSTAAFTEPVQLLEATILRDLALQDTSFVPTALNAAAALLDQDPRNPTYLKLIEQLDAMASQTPAKAESRASPR